MNSAISKSEKPVKYRQYSLNVQSVETRLLVGEVYTRLFSDKRIIKIESRIVISEDHVR